MPVCVTVYVWLCVLFVHRLAAEHGHQVALYACGGDVSKVGPGSLRVGLMDHLYTLTQQDVEKGIRIGQHTP